MKMKIRVEKLVRYRFISPPMLKNLCPFSENVTAAI